MAQNPEFKLSMKRIGIDKTNTRIVAVTAAAAALVVFFLVASYSLLGQLAYQNKVIKAKKAAVSQLRENVKSSKVLVDSYKGFAAAQQNIIGGSATGAGAQDGTNPKIVLDALPGKYDFPALTSSLEKVATDQKVDIESIVGTDDEVAQSSTSSSATATPASGTAPAAPVKADAPVEIPFEIKVSGDYAAIQRVVEAFDRSIRPIQFQKMKITGDQQDITLDIAAKTYYQPEKTLTIQSKVVK